MLCPGTNFLSQLKNKMEKKGQVMFFTMQQAAKFSETDIEKRNLIPAYLENLHIGYIQPRDFISGDFGGTSIGEFLLDKRTEADLLFEAEVLFNHEILPNKVGGPKIPNGEELIFEIEFIKTRNEKPKAVEVIFIGVTQCAKEKISANCC